MTTQYLNLSERFGVQEHMYVVALPVFCNSRRERRSIFAFLKLLRVWFHSENLKPYIQSNNNYNK